MKFKATDEQAKQIAINAILASCPVGMGWMHYNPDLKIETKDIDIRRDEIYFDYVQGRMVKLCMRKGDDGIWEINRDRPNIEFQSWCDKYPTYEDLVKSVEGVEVQ